MSSERDDQMAQDILDAFKPLADTGQPKGVKGRHPSEFLGGPLDGHKQMVAAGTRRVVYRRAIYLAEMNGDFSFIAYERD